MINNTEETKSVEYPGERKSIDDDVKSGLSKMVSVGVSASEDEMANGSAGLEEVSPRDTDRNIVNIVDHANNMRMVTDGDQSVAVLHPKKRDSVDYDLVSGRWNGSSKHREQEPLSSNNDGTGHMIMNLNELNNAATTMLSLGSATEDIQ